MSQSLRKWLYTLRDTHLQFKSSTTSACSSSFPTKYAIPNYTIMFPWWDVIQYQSVAITTWLDITNCVPVSRTAGSMGPRAEHTCYLYTYTLWRTHVCRNYCVFTNLCRDRRRLLQNLLPHWLTLLFVFIRHAGLLHVHRENDILHWLLAIRGWEHLQSPDQDGLIPKSHAVRTKFSAERKCVSGTFGFRFTAWF